MKLFGIALMLAASAVLAGCDSANRDAAEPPASYDPAVDAPPSPLAGKVDESVLKLRPAPVAAPAVSTTTGPSSQPASGGSASAKDNVPQVGGKENGERVKQAILPVFEKILNAASAAGGASTAPVRQAPSSEGWDAKPTESGQSDGASVNSSVRD